MSAFRQMSIKFAPAANRQPCAPTPEPWFSLQAHALSNHNDAWCKFVLFGRGLTAVPRAHLFLPRAR